jgi:hypothetical protein
MREHRLTKELKKHKSDLICKRGDDGKLHVYQERGLEDVLVCSLTDDWQTTGEPVEWGLLPILNRLKAHDLASDGGHEFWSWFRDQNRKVDESKERALKNSVESFLMDFRPQFAKATNDVNTANLAKLDKRRIKDGSFKS